MTRAWQIPGLLSRGLTGRRSESFIISLFLREFLSKLWARRNTPTPFARAVPHEVGPRLRRVPCRRVVGEIYHHVSTQ
jgi:hypothetical protein